MFKKYTALIFLRRNNLEYYTRKSKKVLLQDLTEIKDMDIRDQQAFLREIRVFIEKNKIDPTKAVLVLSDEIIFNKAFTPETSEEDINRFVAKVPLEDEKKEVKKLKTNVKQIVLVVNKNLYHSVAYAFEKSGFKIVHILPKTVYDMKKVTIQTTDEVLKNKNLLKRSELAAYVAPSKSDGKSDDTTHVHETHESISSLHDSGADAGDEPKTSKLKYALAIPLVLILISLPVLTFMINTKKVSMETPKNFVNSVISKVKGGKEEELPPPLFVNEPESTQSAGVNEDEEEDTDIVMLEAGEISLLVLNATETVGLASRTTESLPTENFNIMSVGNAEDPSEVTVIRHLRSVPKDILESLRTTLAEGFETVELEKVEEFEDSYSEYQIVIIAGKELTE